MALWTGEERASDCGAYRWWLARRWGEAAAAARVALFVMLNPSTATALEDDPTIRRCMGFAVELGCGALEVVNLYGLRSPNPSAVWAHPDPIGPENDGVIAWAATRAEVIVAAWGAHGAARPAHQRRVAAVRALLPDLVGCLGRTRRGEPRHPLYLPRGAAWEPLDARARAAVERRAGSSGGPQGGPAGPSPGGSVGG